MLAIIMAIMLAALFARGRRGLPLRFGFINEYEGQPP
jgi:hypothetical protein